MHDSRFRKFSIFSALNFEESQDEILGIGELEGLESCLVRRESAEICDSFTLSYSTRQAALNGDAASYGTRGAPRTRFSGAAPGRSTTPAPRTHPNGREHTRPAKGPHSRGPSRTSRCQQWRATYGDAAGSSAQPGRRSYRPITS